MLRPDPIIFPSDLCVHLGAILEISYQGNFDTKMAILNVERMPFFVRIAHILKGLPWSDLTSACGKGRSARDAQRRLRLG
jgi:hypothetical protein